MKRSLDYETGLWHPILREEIEHAHIISKVVHPANQDNEMKPFNDSFSDANNVSFVVAVVAIHYLARGGRAVPFGYINRFVLAQNNEPVECHRLQ